MSQLSKVCELLNSGVLDRDVLLNECLQYLSSDDIEEILHVLGFDETDEN